MAQEDLVRQTFAQQAVWCAQLGSPFTARLLEGLGERLDRTTAAGRKALDWQGPPDALGDAVALRLAGALHGLVRRGKLADLAALYPPGPLPDKGLLTDTALAAITGADAEIVDWLEFAPQTNEVARSAVLYPGLMRIAQETGLPLSLFEVGASAGLKLFPDKFAYRFGDAAFGQLGSAVQLAPQWTGATPTGPAPHIVGRRGCDMAPLNVQDGAHRERLVAYVWPDQPERLARVQSAIEIARAEPPLLAAGDAAGWVDTMFGKPGERRVTRVLFHSIAYQYFPLEAQQRITARMEAVGEQASDQSPIAWLAFEQFKDQGPRLTLRLWPHGKELVLATADAHCRSISWL